MCHVAVITVTSLGDVTADDGLPLREAVDQAASGDTIIFDATLAGGRMELTQGRIGIEKNLTIDGDILGADRRADITLDANGVDQIFAVLGVSSLTLNALVLTGGSVGGGGGGALGHGLPLRDLVVTGDHGMVLDGRLVNASALVDGAGIRWVLARALPVRITWYHVETETHPVILAEGAPAKIFIGFRGRRAFDNFDEYFALYGAKRIIREMPLPRILARRLLARGA